MARLTGLLRGVGVLAYHLGLSRPVIWLRRRQPKVLAYHACAAEEGPFLEGLDSNTSPVLFSRQLDFLQSHYQIVPLERLHDGSAPAGALVLTFDDGYRSVYTGAFPRLRSGRVPATVYLISDVIDNASVVWVNALLWLLREGPDAVRDGLARRLSLPPTLRAGDFIQAAQSHGEPGAIAAAITEAAAASGLDPAAVARREMLYLRREEIEEMAAAGITFGNHTKAHPNLALLAAESQRSEWAAAESVLAGVPGRVASCAYPFGAHDGHSAGIAHSLGITSVMVIGGVNAPLDLSGVARIPVGESSVAQLFADIEIVAPVKAWLRRTLGRARGSSRPEVYA